MLLMDTAVAMRLSKTCLKQGTVVMKLKTYLPPNALPVMCYNYVKPSSVTMHLCTLLYSKEQE